MNICSSTIIFLVILLSSCGKRPLSPKDVPLGKYVIYIKNEDIKDVITILPDKKWEHQTYFSNLLMLSEKGDFKNFIRSDGILSVKFDRFSFFYNKFSYIENSKRIDKVVMSNVQMDCVLNGDNCILDLDSELGFIYRIEP